METKLPFNALTDPRLRQEFSKNEKAERIVGKRNLGKGAFIIDLPVELGYHCPVCEYDDDVDRVADERLTCSEYNGFIYCYVCNKDYPSVLCQPDIDKAIDIYLDIIDELSNSNKSDIQ